MFHAIFVRVQSRLSAFLLLDIFISAHRPIYKLYRDCGECTSARSQSDRCIQSKTTWLMFIHPKFVYKQKNFPKFQSFLFLKNTPKYDKLSKISNISIKTMLELQTKFGNFGNFGNFGHISDGLRKQYSVRTQCCNLIGSEPLYIPCNESKDSPWWFSSGCRVVCRPFAYWIYSKMLELPHAN